MSADNTMALLFIRDCSVWLWRIGLLCLVCLTSSRSLRLPQHLWDGLAYSADMRSLAVPAASSLHTQLRAANASPAPCGISTFLSWLPSLCAASPCSDASLCPHGVASTHYCHFTGPFSCGSICILLATHCPCGTIPGRVLCSFLSHSSPLFLLLCSLSGRLCLTNAFVLPVWPFR